MVLSKKELRAMVQKHDDALIKLMQEVICNGIDAKPEVKMHISHVVENSVYAQVHTIKFELFLAKLVTI
jgi:hypothetical protein